MVEGAPRRRGRPFAPFLRGWVARVEDEDAAGYQMRRDGLANGPLVVVGQQHLEGMTSHDDQVEPPPEPDGAGVCLHPCHALAACPPPGHVQHGCGRINAEHLAAFAKRRRKKSRPAAEVEDGGLSRGKRQTEARIVHQAVLEVVELDERRILEQGIGHAWTSSRARLNPLGAFA